MISAWDQVSDEGLSPADWLSRRMPMLSSYISVKESAMVNVFGVSSQGGPAGPETATKDPLTRAWIAESVGEPHYDVTVPIQWAAGIE